MNTDTLFEVFQHLSLKDLHTCLTVNREFNQVTVHDTNWKNQIISFISEDTVRKMFSDNYKATLQKYFYFLDRFDWKYLVGIEAEPHKFFKQNKPLTYQCYENEAIHGKTINNYIPTSIEGFQYIPEFSDAYLKLFRKANPSYMCLMTIHVYVKDESMIVLIDSNVDEIFIFINENNQFNIVGCMDEDYNEDNCYISSNETAYYNTDNDAPLLFCQHYKFDKNPVLQNSLLDHIHWYFNEGLKDIWH